MHGQYAESEGYLLLFDQECSAKIQTSNMGVSCTFQGFPRVSCHSSHTNVPQNEPANVPESPELENLTFHSPSLTFLSM